MKNKKSIEQQIVELDNERNILIQQLDKEKSKGMKHVIARTYSAGVFAGFLYLKNGKEVILKNARRIWYWKGAASLSQLAVDGTSKPDECKFPVVVPEITLTETIELIPTTKKAQKSIEDVKEWSE